MLNFKNVLFLVALLGLFASVGNVEVEARATKAEWLYSSKLQLEKTPTIYESLENFKNPKPEVIPVKTEKGSNSKIQETLTKSLKKFKNPKIDQTEIIIEPEELNFPEQVKTEVPEVTENIVRGKLKEIIIESSDHSEDSSKVSRYAIQTTDLNLIPVEFSGARLDEKFRNGKVEVEGSAGGEGSFIVEKIISASREKINRQSVTTSSGESKTSPLHTTLVIPVNFTDITGEPISVSTIRDVLYSGNTSINSQLYNMSNGKLKLGGIQRKDIDIANWITLPHTSQNCQSNLLGTWSTEAKELARGQGFEPRNYRSVILIFPSDIPSCSGWAAQATLGELGSTTDANMIWINMNQSLPATFFRHFLIHELGHNLGLMHSSILKNCQAQNLLYPQSCQSIEYGDSFTPMGNTPDYLRNYNNFHLQQLKWLSSEIQVRDLPQSGTYNLTLFSPSSIGSKSSGFSSSMKGRRPKGYKLISFPLKNSNGVPTGQSAYLEFRTETLPFETFSDDFFQNATKGVSLRFAPSDLRTQTNTYLMDFNEKTEWSNDSALEAGQTYTNSTYGFSLTVNSFTPGSALNLTLDLGR